MDAQVLVLVSGHRNSKIPLETFSALLACTGPRYVCHEVRSQKYIVNKHKSKVLNNSNIYRAIFNAHSTMNSQCVAEDT